MFGMRIFFTTDIRDYTDANHERKRYYLFNLWDLWLFYSEKKNFYITRQLVTLNAANYCGSLCYSGDSFQNTRHPLITQIFVSC